MLFPILEQLKVVLLKTLVAIPQLSVLPLSICDKVNVAFPKVFTWIVAFFVTTTGLTTSDTVTKAVPVLKFPLLSVTVKVTNTGVPIFEQLNVFGVTVIEAMPQASADPLLTWEPIMVAFPEPSKGTVIFWVVTEGLIVSITVTVLLPVVLFPFTSVIVNVTVFVPVFKQLKLNGETVVEATPQASVALKTISEPKIVAEPAAFKYVVKFWADTTGGTKSWTVTVAKPVLLFPFESVTVKITVFAPTFVQLNVVVFNDNVTGPHASVEPLFTWAGVMDTVPALFNWTVIFWVITVGTIVSITVTDADAVDELLLPSVTVNVTVLAPVFVQLNVLGDTE